MNDGPPSEKIGLPDSIEKDGPPVYHTTGLSKDAVLTLCELIAERFCTEPKATGRRRSLGIFKAVVVTLTYLRRNRTQAELAGEFGTSQSTISRTIAHMTEVLAVTLDDWVPTVDDLDPDVQLIVDGTLVPCWSWSANPELWSGKHRTTGLNVQVACTPAGSLVWVSDPTPGRTHDAHALRTSGLLDTDSGVQHLGDKGYIGLGMLTPYRKPPGGELEEWQQEHNKTINSVRSTIERAIAHLKTWRILHIDYRRPLHTFAQTITAVIGLQFFRTAF